MIPEFIIVECLARLRATPAAVPAAVPADVLAKVLAETAALKQAALNTIISDIPAPAKAAILIELTKL